MGHREGLGAETPSHTNRNLKNASRNGRSIKSTERLEHFSNVRATPSWLQIKTKVSACWSYKMFSLFLPISGGTRHGAHFFVTALDPLISGDNDSLVNNHVWRHIDHVLSHVFDASAAKQQVNRRTDRAKWQMGR